MLITYNRDVDLTFTVVSGGQFLTTDFTLQVQHEIRKKWNRRWALRRLSTFSTRSTRTLSLGSTVFVKDKPIPSAMFSDVTINVNVDDKQCHLDLEELKRDDKVTNNNIVDGTRTEKTPSEDENDTLL